MSPSNPDCSRHHQNARRRQCDELRRRSDQRGPLPTHPDHSRYTQREERPFSGDDRLHDLPPEPLSRERSPSYRIIDKNVLPSLGARCESQWGSMDGARVPERSGAGLNSRQSPGTGHSAGGQDFEVFGNLEEKRAFDDEPLSSEEVSAYTEQQHNRADAFYSTPRRDPPLRPSTTRTSWYRIPLSSRPRTNKRMPRPIRGYRRMNNPQADMLLGARPEPDRGGTPIPEVKREEEEDDEDLIVVPGTCYRGREEGK